MDMDSVEVDTIVFQKQNAIGNKAAGILRLLVKNHIVVAGNEDAEFRRDADVPGEEVLQLVWSEALASVSSADQGVCICGHSEPPIHPVGIGEGEDTMISKVQTH